MGKLFRMFEAVLTSKDIFAGTMPYRLELLRRIASVILPEYRFFKWPQMDWWRSDRFNLYLRSFDESFGYNSDRRWMVSQLLRLIEAVPGDTAEVGCFRGAMSWLICQASQQIDGQHQRIHHLFDSFEGLSQPGLNDGTHWKAGALACSENLVTENLSPFEGRFCTYKGWVPERFADVSDRSFAFVHIDVDLHDPTLESMKFFYPRLATGGILVCDDYGFTSCPGATLACDEYLEGKPESMIRLADGGGFLIKGIFTASNLFDVPI